MRPNLEGVLSAAIRLAGRELPLLLSLLLVACGLWVFIAVAGEVIEGDTHALDEALLLALRSPTDRGDPIGPPWLEVFGRDVTALGGFGLLGFITLAVAGFLALQGKRRAALFVLVAVAGGMALSVALKLGFDRPRPALVPHATLVVSASFPSGHSMLSASVYLTLGALLARMQPGRWLKLYVIALAVLVTLAVGISRVYLGVHWPTDVLAGWAAGASWAMICWTVVLWLQRHRKVERSPGDPAVVRGELSRTSPP